MLQDACIDVVLRYFNEALEGNSAEAVEKLVAPSFINHNPLPCASSGRDGITYLIEFLHEVFLNLHIDVQNISATGEIVVAHSYFRGIPQKTFLDQSPTGREIIVPITDRFRVVHGQITERWE